MEHYSVQGQRRETKHKGRNVVWSIAMDKCLIEALVVQAQNGNKIEKCFNENAYTAACISVNTRFNLNLNNQKIINRLKTIKKRYKAMKDLLSQDGFKWNPNTKMIECGNEELWKRYIAAHPDAKALLGKQIEMYEELRIVCGNYLAPSPWAKIKHSGQLSEVKNFEDDSVSFPSASSEEINDTDGTESYTGSEKYMQDVGQEPPLAHPLRRLSKRPRSSDSLQEAILAVASSIRRLADAVDQSKVLIDASELLEAVMEIDGLEEGKQMYAFEYLNADPVKARAFMAYKPRMRKIYLFRQFWWWK